jgi:hypothetical protein
MDGLNLFDRTAISTEYNSLPLNVKNFANHRINEKLHEDANLKTVTHKEYLRLVREVF